jgi:O-antigen ligase
MNPALSPALKFSPYNHPDGQPIISSNAFKFLWRASAFMAELNLASTLHIPKWPRAILGLWQRINSYPLNPSGTLTGSTVLFASLVVMVSVFAAVMIGTGRIFMALSLAILTAGVGFGVVLIQQLRFEVLAGWLMLPLVLIYPLTSNPITSVRMYLGSLMGGLIFLNPINPEERMISRLTVLFRVFHVILLVFTLVSAAFVQEPWNSPVPYWLNTVVPLWVAALLATYIKSPRMLLRQLANVARPLAIILGLIAVVEYVTGTSLYGIPIRIDGLDRRVPGPLVSAEVLGYFLSVLTALILYHRHTEKQNAASRLLNTIALLACIIGATLTFFRSSWFSVIVVWLVYFLFHLPSFGQIKRFVQWMVLISPAMLISVALVLVSLPDLQRSGGSSLFVESLTERLSGNASQNSAGNRATLAASARLMIEDNPWWGVGFGQFPPMMLRYIPRDLPSDQFQVIYNSIEPTDWVGKVAHNSYIQLLAECGIPLFVVFVLAQLLPLFALVVRWRQAKDPKLHASLIFLAMAVIASTAMSFLWQSMLYYAEAGLMWTYLLLGLLMRMSDPVLKPARGVSKHRETSWTPPPS